MCKFSKTTIQKQKVYLQQFQSAASLYKKNYPKNTEKTFYHNRIQKKTKTLAETLLIETLFLNLEALDLLYPQRGNQTKLTRLARKLVLQNKKIFINQKAYDTTYIKKSEPFINFNKLIYIKEKLYLINQNLILLYKTKIKKFIYQLLKTIEIKSKVIDQKIINFYKFLIFDILFKWYIFVSRIFMICAIHFVPFIQLSQALFYPFPAKNIVDPNTGYLFNLLPFLVPLLKRTMSALTNDNFSFLAIGFYLHVFVISFKKYKIPRKVAYQGTFALVAMLYYYSMLLSRDIVVLLYKFTKRFFLLNKFKKIDLLRDDFPFYIEDLEELRQNKEYFVHLGESIFSLDNITKSTKIVQFNTLFSLFGIIALLYNCIYFILRGQKPIIPVVSKTVRRMMIDRNSKEF